MATTPLALLDLSGEGGPVFPGDRISVEELRFLMARRKGAFVGSLQIIEEKENPEGVMEVADAFTRTG